MKYTSRTVWVMILLAYIIMTSLLFTTESADLHLHWTTPDDLDCGYIFLGLYAAFGIWRAGNHRVKINLDPLASTVFVVLAIALCVCSYFKLEGVVQLLLG